MVQWNWDKNILDYIKFGALLLFIKFIYENPTKFNIVLCVIILLVLMIFINQIIDIFEWSVIWYKQGWKQELLIIYYSIYLIIILIIFSPSQIQTSSTTLVSISPIEKYNTEPKTINYNYNLRGDRGQISYIVYGGMNNYLKNQPRTISYYQGESPPNDIDFILMKINNENQRMFINPLIWKIQNITPNKDDQARIIINLIQNIDYDQKNLENRILTNKYPYEVLYTSSGICGEKSELLAYMLREIGYDVAIFIFDIEEHEAVGIKCPLQYSYLNSGYCFIESTSPSIITYSSSDYVGNIKLVSYPKILKISDGISFNSVSEEYIDAINFNRINNMGQSLDEDNYNQWIVLVNKYGLI